MGDDGRSATLLAGLAKASGDQTLTRQAVSTAIRAGEFPLAISLARGQAPDKLALDARLLLVADALQRGKTRDALLVINERTEEGSGGFLAPLLRAWSIAEGGGDGASALATSSARTSLLAPNVDEQRVYLMFRQGQVKEAKALAMELLAKAGPSGDRMRLAVSEALRRAGDRDGASAALSGLSPGVRAAAGKSAPGIAIDTPARGLAAQLFRLAAALAESDDRALPVTLAQIGRHAAPDSSEGMLLLSLLLERQDKFAAALEMARRIPASDPFSLDAREIIARDLLELDRGAEALAMAKAGVAKRDAGSADWALLGNVHGELDQPAESADAYARGRALAVAAQDPRAWTFSLLRADQLEELGRWDDAKAELKAGLAIAPDEPLLLNFLGYGQLERGEDVVGSEAMIRKALTLRPDDPSITDSLGWALFKRGRTDEAIDALRKAAAADPAQWEIHEHLGDALFTVGRRTEARFAWRAALLTAEKKDKTRIENKLDLGLTTATAAP